MKICIIPDMPYPNGMARTKRVHLLAKGLNLLGKDVKIIIPYPTEFKNYINNKKTSGLYEGIAYQYAWNSTVRSRFFLGRRIHDFLGNFITFFLCFKQKPHIILIVGNSIQRYILMKFLSKIIKAKLVLEINEVPYYNNESLNIFQKIKIKVKYSIFDGIVVISETLLNFFTLDYPVKAKIIVLPIITEIKTNSETVFSEISNNLVYTGSLSQKKDGILTIIKAFASINYKYPTIKLILTGDLRFSDVKMEVIDFIKEKELDDKIIFKGYLPEDELINLTNTAKLLVLSKNYNRQNKYNSATKIGEYLRSGRPILLSSVDTACDYLKHRISAFIVEPNEESFAKELDFILDQTELANKVGMKGKEVAMENFDYLKQSEHLINFFEQLINKKD
ncbi:MAG: glycosyltransferase [Bacteroidetes bacterium]|nr:glycosyltransferase [Bacteroidota bacterium]